MSRKLLLPFAIAGAIAAPAIAQNVTGTATGAPGAAAAGTLTSPAPAGVANPGGASPSVTTAPLDPARGSRTEPPGRVTTDGTGAVTGSPRSADTLNADGRVPPLPATTAPPPPPRG